MKWGILSSIIILSGCASVMHGDTQRLTVETRCGHRSVPAQCSVQNSRGHWNITAPAHLTIKKDSDPLVISCASPFFGAQTVSVTPSASMALAANALFGGLLGAGVDVMSGAGLRYPHTVIVNYPGCR